jgi:GNAT superfamily N-acetyltransferase
MFWRLTRKQWDAQRGEANRQALRKIVNAGRAAPGILAYVGKEPIGWCAIAPREQYVALERSRILKPVDDKPVWSISCLFVKKSYRRQGISSELARASVAFAARHGARVVEAYPIQPTMDKMPDPFLWHGVPAAFAAAGFKEVARRSKTRPIMRFEIAD